MINWPRRTLTFTLFALTDYLRSWRFLVELLVGVGVTGVFLSPRGSFNGPQFFTVMGIFMLFQVAYTTWAIMGQGRRPVGYVVLARPLGRGGYLIGHYLAAMAMTVLVYLALTLFVLLLNWLDNHLLNFFTPAEWLSGTLPLLMDAAIISAFVTLITPLVTTPWPRLAVLTLLVVGLSSEANLLEGLRGAWLVVRVHELFGFVLLPVAAGFQLALEGGYSPDSAAILIQQAAIVLVLLAVALFAFGRREIILTA